MMNMMMKVMKIYQIDIIIISSQVTNSSNHLENLNRTNIVLSELGIQNILNGMAKRLGLMILFLI